MNAKMIRTLSATGIVASLLVAASPAMAHFERYGHRYEHAPRHVQPYRPAQVVPPVVVYRYAPPPLYYVPPPAYAPPVHFRHPLRVHHWTGRRWEYRG